MPLAGWICPHHGEQPGRKNHFNYCVTKCKNLCASPLVLEALRVQNDKNPHKGDMISVTMLTGGCDRKTFLERTEDYYVEPDRMIPTFRGSLIHALIEEGYTEVLKNAGWLVEHHMELPMETESGTWTLSGTLDTYDGKSVIYDNKTLQDYAIELMVLGKNKEEFSDHIPDAYIKQLNIYKYMLEKEGYTVSRLRLQTFGFKRTILTGNKVLLKCRSTKWKEQEFDLPDVPILDATVVENIIKLEGDRWNRIMQEEVYPEVCPDGLKWLCKLCPFNNTESCPDPETERMGDVL